jgi:hypothetical protein
MSRKRGRQARQYRVRVRTLRRDPIDYDALARAALEQAAMNQQSDSETSDGKTNSSPRPHHTNRSKGPRHDRLA